MTIDSRNISGSSTAATSATNGIFNGFNVAGFTARPVSIISYATDTLSGATTANTLKTIFNITGSAGVISQLTIRTTDATARTMRVVLTIDGTVVFDRTSAAINSINEGAVLTGHASSTTLTPNPMITFTNSAKLEICSNLTETDKLAVSWAYQTRTS